MTKTSRYAGLCARGMRALALLLASAGSVNAEGMNDVREFRIEAQPLDAALIEFSEQAELQVIVPTELVAGLQSPGVRGEYASTVALAALLDRNGLKFQVVGDDTVTVSTAEGESTAGKARPASRQGVTAQTKTSDPVTSGSEAGGREQEDPVGPSPRDRQIEEIIVLGTNIKGVETASPVFTIEKDEIDRTGITTVGELLETFPQNFGGGVNEDGGAVSGNSTARSTGGSTVNLRGLGSAATLVLLNGRRLAASSTLNFVDVSMIPLSAIERVEVLTDGASATYGSDAVAGVVNFVLASDYAGLETRAQYGTVTKGDADEYRIVQSAGKDWNDTNLFGSYQYRKRGDLEAIHRHFAGRLAYEGAPNREDLDILPSQESHNLLLSATHSFSNRTSMRGHFAYGKRQSSYDAVFQPPDDLRPQDINSDAEQVSATLAWQYEVSDSWDLEVAGVYSNNDQVGEQLLWLSGTTFDLTANNRLWSVDSKVTGDLLDTAGGTVRMAFGAQYRKEEYESSALSEPYARGARNISSVFAETAIPIVGPENSLDGVSRLDLSLAVRYERYSDFGSTTDPKFGLIWAPTSSLKFRGTWGTSFRAPSLDTLDFDPTGRSAFFLDFPDPSMPDGLTTALLEYSGRNDQLGPETSEAYTLGFDYESQVVEGLDVTLTYFNIQYDDRIHQPTNAILAAFVDRDAFAAVIQESPSVDEVNAYVDQLESIANFSGRPFDPAEVEAIFDDRIQNLSATDVNGIDFIGRYNVDAGGGDWWLSLSGSYLLAFENKVTPTSNIDDTINTFLNPIDLRLRGGLAWTGSRWSVGGYLNHQGSYDNDLFTPAVKIGSWTTLDLAVSYDFGDRKESFLTGTELRLNVRNAADRDPPAIGDPAELIGFGLALPVEYDTANASPLGRFVSAEITKAW